MVGMLYGKMPIITSTENDDENLLEINEHGFKNGWATWPVNFDPIWIKCTLPMPIEEDKS
jgi:hypothetical protein